MNRRMRRDKPKTSITRILVVATTLAVMSLTALAPPAQARTTHKNLGGGCTGSVGLSDPGTSLVQAGALIKCPFQEWMHVRVLIKRNGTVVSDSGWRTHHWYSHFAGTKVTCARGATYQAVAHFGMHGMYIGYATTGSPYAIC